MREFLLSLLVLAWVAQPAFTQDRRETLADIRQELSFLHVEIQRLKTELSTTGNSQTATGSGSTLERLDALEGEFRRITGKVEELEFRIDRIVKDGTNRIGDLEFRLVELEGGDVSKLSEATTLGGDLPSTETNDLTAIPETTELAEGEEADFAAAKPAFDDGDYAGAIDGFSRFTEDYPGGPKTPEAHFWRGEAFAALGQHSNAARAFLKSFSADPDAFAAPMALFRLGTSLAEIGQPEEACLTLNEVGQRYPGDPASSRAADEMARLDCAL